ncbi:hypothetical protein DM860_012467 [Cuscuta australis]|uniref:C3H1-type domain-containing protein n=1 Tax=Cuscuta australis TaxID=267555 RepID=A0A328DCW8_9ASTE|nr:hypothetical protein DM860_012467 [Cuscuta australis]
MGFWRPGITQTDSKPDSARTGRTAGECSVPLPSHEELRPPDQYTIIRAQQHNPDRFRTKLCKYRSRCKRAFCSFAHGLKQLQYRNRNPETSGPSSSAAVAPQAMNSVHDQSVRPAAVIPSATQRANGNDHASLNSPAMNMPDLFGQWRFKEFR